MSEFVCDPAEAEVDLIDLRARLLAKTKGISKYDAYQELLASSEGLGLLADVKLVQKRYDEEDQLRWAAQQLEEVEKAK
jgi:hypothetical protein